MTQLAVRNGNGGGDGAQLPGLQSQSRIDEIWFMAESIARSKLFPVKTADEAFCLMLLCDAEKIHPMMALKRYHIIEGRPSMRADAIQAEFLARGGRIKILRADAVEARAVFFHPTLQPEGFEMAVTFQEFEQTGMILGKYDAETKRREVKTNWKHHTADMLWARLVSKGVRRVDPGVVVGISSSDEVEDLVALGSPAAASFVSGREAEKAIAEADAPVPGWDPARPDTRAYHEVATDAIAAAAVPGLSRLDVHKHLVLRAANLGHFTGTLPQSMRPAIEALTRVYAGHRQWVRSELAAYLEGEAEKARLRADAARAQADPDVAAAADVDADETEAGGDAEPGSNG